MVLHIDGQTPSLCLKKVMPAAYAHSHLCFQTYSYVDNDDDYSHDGDADDADDADDAEYDDGSSICSQSPLFSNIFSS